VPTDHRPVRQPSKGWVPIAWGLSEHAPNHPALENFHDHVHRGPGMEQLTIKAIFNRTILATFLTLLSLSNRPESPSGSQRRPFMAGGCVQPRDPRLLSHQRLSSLLSRYALQRTHTW
jgi:hypothetical protein